MSLVGFRARNHPQQRINPDVDDRATTPEMFSGFHQEFAFTIDVAALPHNAKLPRFFTPSQDGLKQSWSGERVWCNPPYSNIKPWVLKAWQSPEAPLIAMLVPANRTEQGWWQRLVEPWRDRGYGLEVRFLSGRIRFIRSDRDSVGPNERPPFGCCLLIWTRS